MFDNKKKRMNSAVVSFVVVFSTDMFKQFEQHMINSRTTEATMKVAANTEMSSVDRAQCRTKT